MLFFIFLDFFFIMDYFFNKSVEYVTKLLLPEMRSRQMHLGPYKDL